MSSILTRCRDAEMMGPICDVISDEKPLTDTIKEMRVNAGIHNEPEITDNDVVEMEDMLMSGDECCCDGECC
jgi:hypothetical protein